MDLNRPIWQKNHFMDLNRPIWQNNHFMDLKSTYLAKKSLHGFKIYLFGKKITSWI